MGLYALGIGPGDEVIIANTNWVASAAPIILKFGTRISKSGILNIILPTNKSA